MIMSRAAALFNRPEAELYRENDGRIPPWAQFNSVPGCSSSMRQRSN